MEKAEVMSYSYLFKYIIIGDTGVLEDGLEYGESLLRLIASLPRLFRAVFS